jgi:clan AA aspartic protease
MGMVYATVELIHSGDLEMVRRGYMDIDEVRQMPIRVMADSGSYMLAINEHIQELMQFNVVERRKAQLANGQVITCDVVGPVDLRFENRRCTCSAFVLPGDSEPLLGAIPMEDMDLVIHPQKQQLMVHPDHPDLAQMKMKKMEAVYV